MAMSYDVCVVGGAGHIGAPLAIVLASRGLRTLGYDINAEAVRKLCAAEMPFLEDGAEPLLKAALAAGTLDFSTAIEGVAKAPVIILTIGTPIDEYHNPRLDIIDRAIDRLIPHLTNDHTLILCSTVFPGVTEHLDRYLKARGLTTKVAFCPERVVQGKAITELQTLPQIVSGTTPAAEETAAKLFAKIAPKIVHMKPREAEFAKLISNAWRYIEFATANQFYMMIESAGLDYARVIAGLREDYPRVWNLPGPGFAAGPCLMKDTMQLVAFENNRFPLGNLAVNLNEGLPNFIVEQLRKSTDLGRKKVGILGMAFKADIDDIRDALSYKLGKILRFHDATVLYSDEYAKDPTFISKEALVEQSDIVIVGVPHRAYRQLVIPSRVQLVDLWGVIPSRKPA